MGRTTRMYVCMYGKNELSTYEKEMWFSEEVQSKTQ